MIKTDTTTQIKAITKPKPVIKLKTSYKIGLNGQYNSGNVNRVLVSSKNTANIDYGNFKTPIIYNFSYGRFKGKLNERENFMHISPSYEHNKFKYYYLTEGEISNLRGIDYRILIGGGIGYSIIETKAIEVTVSDLIINEDVEYQNNTSKHTIRNSTRLKVKANIDNIRLSSVGMYQPSLSDSDNYRWSNNNTVEVKLFKPISTNIAFDQSYESIVMKNKVKYNNSLTIGFIYRFEKK